MLFQSKGITVRSTYLAGAIFLAAFLAAGCGIGEPKQILEDRPVPARAGGALPATPVQDPLPLDSFRTNPCGVLKREQVAALIVDPPDEVKSEPYNIGYDRACKWDKYRAGSLEVGIPRATMGSLEGRMAQHKEDPAKFSQWRELSIDGLPAVEQVGNPPVFEYNGSTAQSCTVEVGAADAELLEFRYTQVNDAQSQYWGTDRCAVALKAAEFVIGNLRGR